MFSSLLSSCLSLQSARITGRLPPHSLFKVYASLTDRRPEIQSRTEPWETGDCSLLTEETPFPGFLGAPRTMENCPSPVPTGPFSYEQEKQMRGFQFLGTIQVASGSGLPSPILSYLLLP